MLLAPTQIVPSDLPMAFIAIVPLFLKELLWKFTKFAHSLKFRIVDTFHFTWIHRKLTTLYVSLFFLFLDFKMNRIEQMNRPDYY